MQLTERQAAQRAQVQGQLEGLSLQRSELQNQLGQLKRRRNELDEQRQVATQSARPGIDARIADVDARSARLDQQILSLDDQIAAVLARQAAAAAEGGGGAGQGSQVIRIPQITIPPMDFGRTSRRNEMRDVAGFMAAEAVLLGLIGVVFWRFAMRRMRDQFERMLGLAVAAARPAAERRGRHRSRGRAHLRGTALRHEGPVGRRARLGVAGCAQGIIPAAGLTAVRCAAALFRNRKTGRGWRGRRGGAIMSHLPQRTICSAFRRAPQHW